MFEQGAVTENHFLQEIERLRALAAAQFPAKPGPARSAALLQTALAAEIACVQRYSLIAISREGLENRWIGAEFLAQAEDERAHMARIAARIRELGAEPDFSLAIPAALPAAGEGGFAKRVAENLQAEQSVIAHYRDVAALLKDSDPESSALIQEILEDEEAHTSDMEDLLATYVG